MSVGCFCVAKYCKWGKITQLFEATEITSHRKIMPESASCYSIIRRNGLYII